MVFTQGRGFVFGASFGLRIYPLRCRVLVCHAADTASLAAWILFGKLIGVATLVGFGEKRCRENLPLGVNLHSKHDHRKPLTKEIALALAVDDLGITESVHGVPFDPTPVSIGRVEVGWLFEFAPVEPCLLYTSDAADE